MGCLLELIYEIVIGGLIEITNSAKIPLAVRLLIATVIGGGLTVFVVLAGFAALDATGVVGAVIAWVIALGIAALWLFWCGRIIRSRNG